MVRTYTVYEFIRKDIKRMAFLQVGLQDEYKAHFRPTDGHINFVGYVDIDMEECFRDLPDFWVSE